MNKRDREQLRASIAKDLVEGQSEHSPTRELLKQYVPLEGIITGSGKLPGHAAPVEKSMAPHATVAQRDAKAWHGATVAQCASVAPPATVECYAEVKGELRVPNTINFSLFPTLDPFAKAVYYQLFLLSHGFRKDTCVVGLAKLAKSVLMSQRKVQNTIVYLEKRGLIKRIATSLGGSSKGNVYQVNLPNTGMASGATVALHATMANGATLTSQANLASDATVVSDATNKYDDDNIKRKSSSNGGNLEFGSHPVENHSSAAAPQEIETAEEHFLLIREAYEKATGNRWSQSDSEAYQQNNVGSVPAAKIVPILETVVRRTPTKINSFKYFVKEITAQPDPRNRAWQKKRLEKIVRKIRDISVGRAGYSMADFAEDVKCGCAREGMPFDNDLFNELVG